MVPSVRSLGREQGRPPGRYYVAYRARHCFHTLLGMGIVDEYRSVSSPLFITPAPLPGRIYNAGISFCRRRHPEMGLDEGWPPSCLGLDLPVSVPADDL